MRGLILLLTVLLAAPAAAAAPSPSEALRVAAGKGDVDAQYRLAQAYQLGKGMPRDAEMAIMWYRRAMTQGHAQASDELGFLMFSNGDRRNAMPFVERAAARGDPRAFYLLGTAHFNGDVATRDWPLAYAQTARAAEAGVAAARANLQMMDQYLLPADRAKADAILATLPPVRRVTAITTASADAATAGPGASVAIAPPAPAPAPAPRQPRTSGNWKVQLGAFGSHDRARTAWDKLSKKVSGLSGLDQQFVAAGTVQRLQAWGIANRADADTLCTRVRAAGGDCLVLAPAS